jgi:hypothetical protein
MTASPDISQFLELPATCLTQAPQDEPRAFLGDADLFCQLHRRNALAGCNEQIHRVDPLVQRDMRPLENRSRPNGEIKLASVAAIEASLTRRDTVSALASRARRTVRPQTALQVHARGFFVWEQLKELEGADGGARHLIFRRDVAHNLDSLTSSGPWIAEFKHVLGRGALVASQLPDLLRQSRLRPEGSINQPWGLHDDVNPELLSQLRELVSFAVVGNRSVVPVNLLLDGWKALRVRFGLCQVHFLVFHKPIVLDSLTHYKRKITLDGSYLYNSHSLAISPGQSLGTLRLT